MEPISKNKWQIRLAALIIFALGFIAGGLSLNLYYAKFSAASPRGNHQKFERMIESLNLSSDQKTEVDKIMSDARAQFKDAHKETAPKFAQIREQLHEHMKAVLTPEQWQKFEQMGKEMKERHRHHGFEGGDER